MPDYTTGFRPYSPAFGDVNGDGRDDVVVFNDWFNTFSIFLGNADGTLSALPEFAANASTRAVRMGDFNSDGLMDLLTTISTTGGEVRLSNGDGTFQAPLAFAGGAPAATGDFNGDGRLDIVAGGRIGLGQGDGTFIMSSQAFGPVGSTQTGDINGDGLVDIAVYTTSAPGARVATYLGNGDGTFQARSGLSGGSSNFVLGDLNGDGRADLVNGSGQTVRISLSNGDGTFTDAASLTITTAQTILYTRLGDFNFDGVADLAVGLPSNGDSLPAGIGMYLGRGDGTFRPQVFYPRGREISDFALGDTNGDGGSDIVMVDLAGHPNGIMTHRTDLAGRVVVGTPGDDFVTGTEGADVLIGNAGGDLINGLYGADTMSGGQGDDLYVVDHISDVVTELSGEGRDVIQSSVSYTVAAGNDIEVLTTNNQAGTALINFTGNALANSLYGNDGYNVLDGGDGADYIMAYGGNDYILGGRGDDVIDGGAGADGIQGGEGNDYLVGGDSSGDLLQGQDGNDVLRGNGTNNGGAGDDVIYGGYGVGGAGNDSYFGSGVNELAGEGFDYYYANNSIEIGEGNEVEVLATSNDAGTAAINIAGNSFAQNLYGNNGANVLNGRGGDDYVVGLGGGDTLIGGDGADAMDGGEGADTLNGDAGADYLVGGAGADILNGGADTDRMLGGAGDDTYVVDVQTDQVVELAGEGFDRISTGISLTLAAGTEVEMLVSIAGSGAISLAGNEFANSIYGNEAANTLSGGAGDDYLVGDAGNDTLNGDAGGDAMTGGAGDDALNGGDGNDYLVGGLGNDILTGGAGADSFLFDTVPDLFANIDRVMAFTVAQDRLLLDDAIYSGLSAGQLPANAFRTGTAAADADDRIIYDPATGFLYYDSDGSGGGAAVQFATLDTGLALSASDLWVV